MERPAGKGTLVHFRCQAPDHRAPGAERSTQSDRLTLVEGLWAYCPFDVRTTGHDWRPTGGVTMEQLLRQTG